MILWSIWKFSLSCLSIDQLNSPPLYNWDWKRKLQFIDYSWVLTEGEWTSVCCAAQKLLNSEIITCRLPMTSFSECSVLPSHLFEWNSSVSLFHWTRWIQPNFVNIGRVRIGTFNEQIIYLLSDSNNKSLHIKCDGWSMFALRFRIHWSTQLYSQSSLCSSASEAISVDLRFMEISSEGPLYDALR